MSSIPPPPDHAGSLALHGREVDRRMRLAPLVSAGVVIAAGLAGCGGGSSPAGSGEMLANMESPAASKKQSEGRCTEFLGQTIEGATITRASLVPAADDVPEHCVVRGELPQDLDFEVRMPTDWNRRVVFLGGGGFDGTIRPHGNAVRLSPNLPLKGYATIAANHGHNANVTPGATFALDPGMLADYGYLAVPRTLAPAKAILRLMYGGRVNQAKIVYEGCSGGGRQGLIQAQRYPDLFDGVISRAPANAYTPQFLWYQQVQKQLAAPGAALSEGKIRTISAATMAKCDGLDGLADNMIGRPDACTFDPAELTCTGAETDSCLTPAQVQSARAFYAPTDVANGRYKWPGFLPGGEAPGWLSTGRASLGSGYMNYMVVQNPDVDWLQVDPAQYTTRIDQLVNIIDAVNPDLTQFKASGGKLILWTGLSDWLITANNATEYYKSVVERNGSQAVTDQFVEYYTSPSVQHCADGTGADVVDLVTPMFDWIEKGIKPSSNTIIATQSSGPASRPVCQYPKYPKYVGGDPDAAASFVCTTP